VTSSAAKAIQVNTAVRDDWFRFDFSPMLKKSCSKIPFHPLHGINLFASLENNNLSFNNLSFFEEWKPNLPVNNSPLFFPDFVGLVILKIGTDVFFRSRGPFLVLFFLFLHFKTMLLAFPLNYNAIEWYFTSESPFFFSICFLDEYEKGLGRTDRQTDRHR